MGRYVPGVIPSGGVSVEQVLEILQRELQAIAEASDNAEDLQPQILHAEPSKLNPGMVAYADGADWNPGSGEGLYRRNKTNTAWESVGSVADGSITTAKLADNAVTQAKVADAAIGTAELIDSNVTTAKIANDAVTYAKIQNVTDARLLGRSAGSAGDIQEITVGTGLALSSGALTQAAKASFRAHKNGTNQTNIASSDTKVTFGTENFDDGGNYDTSTSTFTAPRTGDYLVSAYCNMNAVSATSTLRVAIYVNGAVARVDIHASADAAANKTKSVCDVIRLTAGDTVEVYARDNTASSNGIVSGTATDTWFAVREL